jgi:hypothetical protein
MRTMKTMARRNITMVPTRKSILSFDWAFFMI